MTKYVHLVFSDPPAGVTEDEFNEWYDAHVQEILAVDGWVAATRYRIAPEVGADESGGYRFLSLYELDIPPEQAVANLAAAGMGNADTYIEMKGESDDSQRSAAAARLVRQDPVRVVERDRDERADRPRPLIGGSEITKGHHEHQPVPRLQSQT